MAYNVTAIFFEICFFISELHCIEIYHSHCAVGKDLIYNDKTWMAVIHFSIIFWGDIDSSNCLDSHKASNAKKALENILVR